MNFGKALKRLKSWKRIRRAGWTDKGMWLTLIEALLVKLRRKEANRKAMSDIKSRQRSVPVRGRAPVGARLQTYQGALHARMAPKKYGG